MYLKKELRVCYWRAVDFYIDEHSYFTKCYRKIFGPRMFES